MHTCTSFVDAQESVGSSIGDHERKPLLDEKISSWHPDQRTEQATSTADLEKASNTILLWFTRLKQLLPFLGVFGPLVIFWAIFYQQNSTWILQGAQMNCHLGRLQVPPGDGPLTFEVDITY